MLEGFIVSSPIIEMLLGEVLLRVLLGKYDLSSWFPISSLSISVLFFLSILLISTAIVRIVSIWSLRIFFLTLSLTSSGKSLSVLIILSSRSSLVLVLMSTWASFLLPYITRSFLIIYNWMVVLALYDSKIIIIKVRMEVFHTWFCLKVPSFLFFLSSFMSFIELFLLFWIIFLLLLIFQCSWGILQLWFLFAFHNCWIIYWWIWLRLSLAYILFRTGRGLVIARLVFARTLLICFHFS